MINSRLHGHNNYTFDSRWVSVYIWAFVSIWVSICLRLGIWVGEETKWMGSSLINKTMCHSLSLPEVEPVNIFLGKLTLGRQEAEWRQMVAVVGKTTDKPSFPSSGYENLGNGMQINSFTLIVKKKIIGYLYIRPRCQRSYRLLHSLVSSLNTCIWSALKTTSKNGLELQESGRGRMSLQSVYQGLNI